LDVNENKNVLLPAFPDPEQGRRHIDLGVGYSRRTHQKRLVHQQDLAGSNDQCSHRATRLTAFRPTKAGRVSLCEGPAGQLDAAAGRNAFLFRAQPPSGKRRANFLDSDQCARENKNALSRWWETRADIRRSA